MAEHPQCVDSVQKGVSFSGLEAREVGDGEHITLTVADNEVVTMSKAEWREFADEVTYAFRWKKEQIKVPKAESMVTVAVRGEIR
jgi:hypothetical protein